VPAEIQNGVWSECAINAGVISETYKDMATGKRQIRRFQPPHSGLTTPRHETPSTNYKWFISPKLESLTYIFPADNMGVFFLLFSQLSLEDEPCESKTASTKTEFYVK